MYNRAKLKYKHLSVYISKIYDCTNSARICTICTFHQKNTISTEKYRKVQDSTGTYVLYIIENQHKTKTEEKCRTIVRILDYVLRGSSL